MTLFNYKALDNSGKRTLGSIDAISMDVAIGSLQKRGLIVADIEPAEKESWFSKIKFGSPVSSKDIVVLSRQISALFEAQISPLKIFSLLAEDSENQSLKKSLNQVTNDLQAGSPISKALEKHSDIFSSFYVNMVRAGEETGKLNETFRYLADYINRNYEVVSRARNALIYPSFVVTVFIAVMILMFTFVIPKISLIIISSGQEVPFYTSIVFAVSDFLVNYSIIIVAALVAAVLLLIRFARTQEGHAQLARFKLDVPYLGNIYRKLYLGVIADNLNTMIVSGIPMIKALEVTSAVVENDVYKEILRESLDLVKGGSSLSQSLSQYQEMPNTLVQMVKVGEESGQLGSILGTMAKFYEKEVMDAVDNLVSLIEPMMIVLLGVSVGIIMASVLIPIYQIANSGAL